MAASLLGSGGYGTTATTHTQAAPAVLYDQMGTLATADYGACTAYAINNNHTANWLWVHIEKFHVGTQGTPIMPGSSLTFVAGHNFNNMQLITAWGTIPGAPTGTASAIPVSGGFQKKD